ncbi:MAG: hypothetical protein Q9194_006559 [Teloschistes cf. exilis]
MAQTSTIVPGIEPPNGQRSNFVNPPSQRGLILAVATLAITFSTFFVIIRIYTRHFVTRKLWWDDWTCILGWVGLLALASLMFKALDYGGGVDLWNVPETQYRRFMRLFHDIEIVARIAMFFTKASIVLLYHRIFVPDSIRRTGVWWAIWFVFWWNLLYTVALVLVVTTDCIRKETEVGKSQECLKQPVVVFGATVINLVSDLMILIIPMIAIWGLQMAKKKKLRVLAVFAMGSMNSPKIVINSFFANRRSPKPLASLSSPDPSRVRSYEELDEIESQRRLAISDKWASAGSMAVHDTV